MGKKKHSLKDYGVGYEFHDKNYSPYLVHPSTYSLLLRTFLRLSPQDRNVFLAMNEYELSSINPQLAGSGEAPTHIIIFSVRLIRISVCQPVGGLLIYQSEDQSLVIAECMKAFISDLSMIGIHILGTISPPSTTFKNVLSHLVNGVFDFSRHSGAITYSVTPFGDLVHIYDITYIVIEFQKVFKESVTVKYIKNGKIQEASWDDILLTLTSSNIFRPEIYDVLYDNLDIDFNIFTTEFANKFQSNKRKRLLSETQEGTWELVHNIHKLTRIFEKSRVDSSHLFTLFNELTDFQIILFSICFKRKGINGPKNSQKYSKIKKPSGSDRPKGIDLSRKIKKIDNVSRQVMSPSLTTNGIESVKPSNGHIYSDLNKRKGDFVNLNEDSRRIDFEDDPPIELEENCMQNILDLIDSSLEEEIVEKENKKNYEKINDKSTGHPYEKPLVNNRKRKTKEELKIDKLEKNLIAMDLCDKENVSKNNEINRSKQKPKSKITNLLMEYLHSESYKKLDKSEIDVCKSKNNGCDNGGSVNSDKEIHQLNNNTSESMKYEPEIDFINNLKKSNASLPQQNFDNFSFEVKNMSEFVNTFFCLKPCGTDYSDHIIIQTNKLENDQSNNVDFPCEDELFADADDPVNLNEIYMKSDDSLEYDEVLYSSPSSERGFLIEAKEFISCDKKHADDQSCNVCLLESLKKEGYSESELAKDWLTVISGLSVMSKKLKVRRVKYFDPLVFSVEHIDFFVSLIKKVKNNVPTTYGGREYSFLDCEGAFKTLNNDIGLYLVKKDNMV